MASPFDDLISEMDAVVLDVLGNDTADYLSAEGAVLAKGIRVIIEKNVERMTERGFAVDRQTTFTVVKALLKPLDRQGAFRLSDGKLWNIDGLAANDGPKVTNSDDGHLITFYVVP